MEEPEGEAEEGWGDEDIDEVVLASQWSTAVPLGGVSPWGQTHSEGMTTTSADGATAAAADGGGIDECEAEFAIDDDEEEETKASLRQRLGQLLLQLDNATPSTIINNTSTSTSTSSFATISRPLARRGTLPSAATAASTAAPAAAAPALVEEAVAAELVEVMSRCCYCSSSQIENEDEEEGGRREGRREGENAEDVLQYMVWSRCLPSSLPSSSSSSSSSLRQQQQEQQQSERFFLALCQLLGRRDVSVPLFLLFCERAVLPRLVHLKVRREGGREGGRGGKGGSEDEAGIRGKLCDTVFLDCLSFLTFNLPFLPPSLAFLTNRERLLVLLSLHLPS